MKLPGPNRLLIAVENAAQLHPFARSGAVAAGARADAETSLVWDRLRTASVEHRDAAVRALTKREEKAVLYGAPSRFEDPVCLQILGRLFVIRDPDAGRVAWEAFLLTNGQADFRRQATRLAESHGEVRAWPLLARADRPLDAAVELYLRSPDTFEVWVRGAAIELHGSRLVTRALRRMLLSSGNHALLVQREGLKTIEAWLSADLIDSERITWYRSYLLGSDARAWQVDDPILTRILERFLPPVRGRPFWEGVPESKRDSFELWLRNVELTRLLGEGPRVAFWRVFLPWIDQSLGHRSRNAVFVCFDNWFAVQFVEMGRATYMFDRSFLSLFRSLDEQSLYRAVLESPALGRYTHQGWYWAERAESVVRSVLRDRSV
jgi:hypothetical protein